MGFCDPLNPPPNRELRHDRCTCGGPRIYGICVQSLVLVAFVAAAFAALWRTTP